MKDRIYIARLINGAIALSTWLRSLAPPEAVSFTYLSCLVESTDAFSQGAKDRQCYSTRSKGDRGDADDEEEEIKRLGTTVIRTIAS